MIKDILVCLNNTNTDSNTIQAAAKFALENDARLLGLYILVDSVNRYYASESLSVDIMRQIMEEEKELAVQAEKRFNQITEKIGCNTAWQCVSENDEPIQAMFYTDLIFMSYGESKKGARFTGSGFINHLLLETGRPIVIIPQEWTENTFGKKIMLGWNESRESASAMHEVLPLMQQAEKVNIVTVNRRVDDEDNLAKGIEVSAYLSRHGVNCQFYTEQTDKDTPEIGEVLLAHSDENDNDLIVIGGYSHSHLREIFLGGVTRYLTRNTNVPLILVH